MTMKKAVVCTVPTILAAGNVVDSLKVAGFSNADISVITPDQTGAHDAAIEKHSKAPEGTAAGAGGGALLGGALGWLAGIGALAIPGVGPMIAAGPFMAFLAGAATGAATGGVIGGLVGLGMPEMEAKVYEGKLSQGNTLIAVHTEDGEEAKRVEEIFKAQGANDIKRTNEASVKNK